MPRLKHQQQKPSTNCGPACVAILARTTQDRACRAMFGRAEKRDYSSDWADIRRALKRLRLRFGKRANYVSRWQSVPTTAIVSCCRRTKGDHVVVFSPDEGADLRSEAQTARAAQGDAPQTLLLPRRHAAG